MAVIVNTRSPLQLFSLSLKHLKEVQFTQKDLNKIDTRKKYTKILYLNQSYLFHLVALWEKFIEDLAVDGFKKLAKTADFGPAEPSIKSHFDFLIKGMNSPNQENIDKFFLNALVIEKISSSWEWEGMSKGQACKILKEIMEARNQIGHTSSTSHVLTFEKNFHYMKHLFNLAFLTENAAERYIAEKLGEEAPQINKNVPYPDNLVNLKSVKNKKGK